MKTFIKLVVLIGFMCAITTPAISAEENVTLMLGGKY
jgi:hypothetical protein